MLIETTCSIAEKCGAQVERALTYNAVGPEINSWEGQGILEAYSILYQDGKLLQ